MTYTASTNHKILECRNVERFREMPGMKQDALAADLGGEWNQQKRYPLSAKREMIEKLDRLIEKK